MRLLIGLLLSVSVAAQADDVHPGAEAFVEMAVSEHGLDADEVWAVLAEARYQQSIIDAMTRPAEARPWYQYRPIFLTETRIDAGAEFWRANRDLLEEVSERFGVPVEIIVSIVGVETNYGVNTGSFRVIDALATLGFYYPRRAAFFSRELAQFLRLAHEENLPVNEVRGSYAGAMGIGQFIPSSYRAYAVDFDGSGSRDLWRSLPDALGSVANYLAEHDWDPDGLTVLPVNGVPDDLDFEFNPRLATSLEELAGQGIDFDRDGLSPDTPATLVELETENGREYWVGLNNFYVITRYNRSPLYAMAVIQLAEAIRERKQ
ncbi:lytic murein transglycosylase B [Wenzhouxiangella sp. AB-CW3]|uniref:lytic murein transglycosylase B n=1 Tax=Wenzhouxiangella sp. AB-CW3 TaxID=2771012 RepID=UPI00168AD955|nr:lytic murein transglycosylase B [Wenzhouxiangella sp. AB-CW3]QOC22795.1 lytic murein transglycosylase B [Wenzhouxiangella sp. AB-CW3]